MIKILITKNKGSDKKDKAIFERVVEISKTTFGINGRTEVLLFRRKHFDRKPDIQILIEEEQDIFPEIEKKICEKFNYSDLGMNADISIHETFKDAADHYEIF